MPFFFNFSRQYKIWISPKPNQFLPLRNQLRIIHEIQANPGIEMKFIYSRACLNDDAEIKMNEFCLNNGIIPVEFESLLPLLKEEKDQRVAAIACNEIEQYRNNAGGNLASASDCIRSLRHVIENAGIYSDFDVRSTLMDLSIEWVQTLGPLLFFGTQLPNARATNLACNNDFLAFSVQGPESDTPFALSDEATRCVHSLQDVLIDNYSSHHTMATFFDFIEPTLTIFVQKTGQNSLLSAFILKLKQDTTSRNVFDLRQHIAQLMTLHSDKEIQSFLYQCLKETVEKFSGPGIYPNLFKHFSSEKRLTMVVSNNKAHAKLLEVFLQSSIGYYDAIYDHIKSPNEIYQIVQVLRENKKPGGDLSWMPDGQDRMQTDETKLEQYSLKVLRFWREKRPTRLLGVGAQRIQEIPTISEALRDKRPALAFRKAVVGGEIAVIRCLLECRKKNIVPFDINEPSSNGNTALDWANLTKYPSDKIKNTIISLLTDAGAEAHNTTLSEQGAATLQLR